MKRTGRLFERVIQRDTLRLALSLALRGKRNRPEVRRFTRDVESQLADIQCELATGTFVFGNYHQFLVHDPKLRVITAPIFRERIVHHALMHVCAPTFERWLIDDTYACRVGRGRIAALQRAARFMKRSDHYLELDIRKYFDSIPQSELVVRLERVFKDRRLLDTFEAIVNSFRGSMGVGIPIGSLTSQYFANFYLGWFDRHVKEHHRVRGYVRYMDDMVLWSDSASELRDLRGRLRDFLQDDLQLLVKRDPSINRSEHGLDFLGCRLYRNHITLNRCSRVRFRRQLATLIRLHDHGRISDSERQQRETALHAFATSADVKSWQFRSRTLEQLTVSGYKARIG